MEGAGEAEVLGWILVKPTGAVGQRERRDPTLRRSGRDHSPSGASLPEESSYSEIFLSLFVSCLVQEMHHLFQ